VIQLTVTLDGDGCWPDLEDKIGSVIHLNHGELQVAVLDNGMTSGKPSITIRVDLPDKVVLAETSARLFCTAAKLIMAKYPDLFED
jgi:hypothetical protein